MKKEINNYTKIAGIAQTGINFLLKRDKVIGLPTHILIEFTSKCNLGCPACPRANGSVREDNYIKTEKFKHIVKEIMPSVVGIGGLGEPFLAPNVFELIKYCKKKNIYTYLTTNGTLLEKNYKDIINSGLNQLSISIDGHDRESYKSIRSKDFFEKIINGIKKINDNKKKSNSKNPLLAMHVVVQEKNYRNLSQFIKLADSLKIKKVFYLQLEREVYQNNEALFSEVNQNELLQGLKKAKKIANALKINTNISFWENNFNDLKKKYQKRAGYPLSDKICIEPWSTMFISLEGEIYPCCALQSQKGSVGNIFQKKIKDIWNGKKIATFRKNIKNNKKTFFRCKECIPRGVTDIISDFKRREVI